MPKAYNKFKSPCHYSELGRALKGHLVPCNSRFWAPRDSTPSDFFTQACDAHKGTQAKTHIQKNFTNLFKKIVSKKYLNTMTFKMVGVWAIFAILYFCGLDLENTKLLLQSQGLTQRRLRPCSLGFAQFPSEADNTEVLYSVRRMADSINQ